MYLVETGIEKACGYENAESQAVASNNQNENGKPCATAKFYWEKCLQWLADSIKHIGGCESVKSQIKVSSDKLIEN